ncbi:MAG: hypothetical protein AB7F09_16645 [Parvibaculaceae bacterium]
MSRKVYRPATRVTDRLHPGLYLALVALALWFVLSAWAFAGGAYTDYLLVVASGLILVAIAIPAALWRIWRHHPHAEEDANGSLRQWASSSEFRIWQDRMKAKDAALEILLPVAAVAFGMSLLAIVLHYTAH